MRLSGVDPGIIRELSGIYKPFVKAFKELISNAYDADAKRIEVRVADDFASIEVNDDGHGMTPFHFQQDFARLGGSTAWLQGGRSPGGRARIGYKGIGFLAVARYCRSLVVRSPADRKYHAERAAKLAKGRLRLKDLVPPVLSWPSIAAHVRVTGVRLNGKKLRPRHDWRSDGDELTVLRRRDDEVVVSYDIDCRHLEFEAELDFDHLLSLERRADLHALDDFCTLRARDRRQGETGTTVILCDLKDFVVRELGAPPAKGKAKNIVNKSGKDQFLWRLARSAPIRDETLPGMASAVRKLVAVQEGADLPTLHVAWRAERLRELRRPVYLPKAGKNSMEESILRVEISEGELHASGYVLARSEVVYPAESRGLTIRVRNVAIGDASFLGWETRLSGPRKAALSQITGEIVVHGGLDAADAINPGRESFYDENADYRTLKRGLVGNDDQLGGVVAQAAKDILDRITVRSHVTARILEARQRRAALDHIASAVNYYGRGHLPTGPAVTQFFRTPLRANGLSSARDVPLKPTSRLSGFEIIPAAGLQSEFDIDFKKRNIQLDFERDVWNTTVYLAGHYYDVRLKQGKAEQAICEFDNEKKRIYVNWGHPVRQQMDDPSFLRSAVLLRFAHHVARTDADSLLDLALNMLAFRVE